MGETAWDQVRKYLNSHGRVSLDTVRERFPNIDDGTLIQYYSRWKRWVEPLKRFHKVVTKKFKPRAKLSVRDMETIRKVERIIEGDGTGRWE